MMIIKHKYAHFTNTFKKLSTKVNSEESLIVNKINIYQYKDQKALKNFFFQNKNYLSDDKRIEILDYYISIDKKDSYKNDQETFLTELTNKINTNSINEQSLQRLFNIINYYPYFQHISNPIFIISVNALRENNPNQLLRLINKGNQYNNFFLFLINVQNVIKNNDSMRYIYFITFKLKMLSYFKKMHMSKFTCDDLSKLIYFQSKNEIKLIDLYLYSITCLLLNEHKIKHITISHIMNIFSVSAKYNIYDREIINYCFERITNEQITDLHKLVAFLNKFPEFSNENIKSIVNLTLEYMINNDTNYKNCFIENNMPIHKINKEIIVFLIYYSVNYKSNHKNLKKLVEIVHNYYDKFSIPQLYPLLLVSGNVNILKNIQEMMLDSIKVNELGYKHHIALKFILFQKYIRGENIDFTFFIDIVNNKVLEMITLNSLELLELIQILSYIKKKSIEIYSKIMNNIEHAINDILPNIIIDSNTHNKIKKCNILYLITCFGLNNDILNLRNELKYFNGDNLREFSNLIYFQKMIINNLLYIYNPELKGFYLNHNEKVILSYDSVIFSLADIIKKIDDKMIIEKNYVYKKNYLDIYLPNKKIGFIIALNTNILDINNYNDDIIDDSYISIQKKYFKENIDIDVYGLSDELILSNPEKISECIKNLFK